MDESSREPSIETAPSKVALIGNSPVPPINEEFIRAEREDDDGYDPYSDRIAVDPLFEEDPWR